MRFMMLMIPQVYQGGNGQAVGPGFVPDEEDVARMTQYNEELSKAGVLIGLDGLHPPLTGGRVSFLGGKPTVPGTPIPGEKNVLGGYWMIDVTSKEEAIAWAKRCPAQDGDVIEVRQVFEISEFPAELQKAAGFEPVPARPARERHRSSSAPRR